VFARILFFATACLLTGALTADAQVPTLPSPPTQTTPDMAPTAFKGIYTVIYRVPDIAEGTAWYRRAFDLEPYFEEPFYVGFNVRGFELGLQPEEGTNRAGAGGTVAYWGVDNADDAVARLIGLGAAAREPVQDVGGGIRVATVTDPFGNVLGIIENPHFRPEGP
jgi:predicted enzyme related to lactoylglutathione lyase